MRSSGRDVKQGGAFGETVGSVSVLNSNTLGETIGETVRSVSVLKNNTLGFGFCLEGDMGNSTEGEIGRGVEEFEVGTEDLKSGQGRGFVSQGW